MTGTATSNSMRLLVLALTLVGVGGCSSIPPTTVRMQGTVTAVGLGLPVPGAEVIVEWGPRLGGGTTVLKTDISGHYAVSRTVKVADAACSGITLTVRAAGFASAYSHPEAACGKVLSFDFKLFPLS